MNPASGDPAEMQRNPTALGRYGHPDEIASATAYIARPESAFITGTHWNVDGGFTA